MWSQREGGLSAITQVHPVRYLLQNGVNTVRYLLSNGVKVFSPEIYNIARGQGFHFLEASTAARINGECVSGVPGSKSVAGNSTVHIGTWENGAADKATIQRVRVSPCQLPEFRHVVMPHLGMGNHPGDAWCKRPGRPEHLVQWWVQPEGLTSMGA